MFWYYSRHLLRWATPHESLCLLIKIVNWKMLLSDSFSFEVNLKAVRVTMAWEVHEWGCIPIVPRLCPLKKSLQSPRNVDLIQSNRLLMQNVCAAYTVALCTDTQYYTVQCPILGKQRTLTLQFTFCNLIIRSQWPYATNLCDSRGQGCQTRGVMAASRDLLWLPPHSLNKV